MVEGFTKKYQIHDLVYVESYGEIGQALYREKQLKKWHRKWKLALEKENYKWEDLFLRYCYSLDPGSSPG